MYLFFFLGVLWLLFLVAEIASLICAVKRNDPGLTVIALICGIAWLFTSVSIGDRL
jgi:hypothetical protein